MQDLNPVPFPLIAANCAGEASSVQQHDVVDNIVVCVVRAPKYHTSCCALSS